MCVCAGVRKKHELCWPGRTLNSQCDSVDEVSFFNYCFSKTAESHSKNETAQLHLRNENRNETADLHLRNENGKQSHSRNEIQGMNEVSFLATVINKHF